MKPTSHDSPLTTKASRGFCSRLTTHDSRAFTVVELSVVLVVLGVILTSVLKLEQVYRNYRIRAVMNQARELSAAVKVYRDKFGYWPGDDPYATAHVGTTNPTVVAGMGNNGDGDDKICDIGYDDLGGKLVYEYILAAVHLARAGIISPGYLASNNTLKYPFGRVDIVAEYHKNNGVVDVAGRENELFYASMPPDVAQSIDSTLDDGDYRTGSVRGSQFESYPSYIDSKGSHWCLLPYNYSGTDQSKLLVTIAIE